MLLFQQTAAVIFLCYHRTDVSVLLLHDTHVIKQQLFISKYLHVQVNVITVFILFLKCVPCGDELHIYNITL